MNNRIFTLIKSVCCLTAIFSLSTMLFAKEIDLYEAPKPDSKVVGKVDLAKGIIPIFTPKNSEWIKVGDPANGNVGWVRSNDLNTKNGSTVTFTQRIINDDGKGPRTYQIIEYGEPNKLTEPQVQDMVQKMQKQQQAVQQSMQKVVQDMMKELDSMYHQFWQPGNSQSPVIMPIIVMPEQKKPVPTTKIIPKPPINTNKTEPETVSQKPKTD